MKLVILILIFLRLGFGSFTIKNDVQSQLYQNLEDQFRKRTYSISNDSMNIVLNVVMYSKAIINYDLAITTKKIKISQNGFALNLTSEMNGGIEYEPDDTNNTVSVIPYNTYYCDCNDKLNFEIRISTDMKKVNIYSSRQLRCDLFNEKLLGIEKSKDLVPLSKYLYLNK